MDAFDSDKLEDIMLQLNDEEPKKKQAPREEVPDLDSQRVTTYTDSQFQSTSINLVDRNMSFQGDRASEDLKGVVVFTLLFKVIGMFSYLFFNLVI